VRSYFRAVDILLLEDVIAGPQCETLTSSSPVVATGHPGSDEGVGKEAKRMLERLLDIEVSEYGTVTEEIELICTMTGFRRRFLVHHIGEGFFRSVELGPS
jgi:hypothetical protein